jgi:hypothetical protein
MEDVGISCGHLVYFTAIACVSWPVGFPILWSFGTFSPVLVCCTKKNLATLTHSCRFCLLNFGFEMTNEQKKFPTNNILYEAEILDNCADKEKRLEIAITSRDSFT